MKCVSHCVSMTLYKHLNISDIKWTLSIFETYKDLHVVWRAIWGVGGYPSEFPPRHDPLRSWGTMKFIEGHRGLTLKRWRCNAHPSHVLRCVIKAYPSRMFWNLLRKEKSWCNQLRIASYYEIRNTLLIVLFSCVIVMLFYGKLDMIDYTHTSHKGI